MIELAILGLLKEQELHGYELKKQLGELLGPSARLSYGTLYPALNRLEAAGAVKGLTARTQPSRGDRLPMTGSLGAELASFRARRAGARASGTTEGGRRGKRVYAITAEGETLFNELLQASTAEDDRDFQLRLIFARHLPPAARLGLFERRRGHLLERLRQARDTLSAANEGVDTYTQALMQHRSESTERDVSWLESLIEQERKEISV